MDCYKVLRVSEDASDEEIYKAYIALLSSYSASYNTSPYARRKQREIERAYNAIQNELKRKVYAKEEVVENVKEDIELFDYDTYKDTVDDVSYVSIPLKEASLFKDVDATSIVRSMDIVTMDVDYSYYVLQRKFRFDYKVKEICNHSVDSIMECSCCNTIGKVEYNMGVIYCPVCESSGSVRVHNCEYCNDNGYVYKDVSEYIYIDNDIVENGIEKDGVLYRFNFVNKDKVVEEKNHIYIEYDLSYDECINGVDVKWDTFYGPIVIKSDVNDLKKDYVFERNKKIHIVINKLAYKGKNISKYLFIKSSDIHKKIYLDTSSCLYSNVIAGSYNKEIIVDGESVITLQGYGEEGLNGGEKGDLIITPIITNRVVSLENIEDYNIVKLETSPLFNLFGGRVNGKFFMGLKGKNAAVVKDNSIYILSGRSKEKRPMYTYFLFSVFVYMLWLLIPMLLFILPYTEQDLIVSCVFTIVYSIVANIVLNIKG